MDLLDHLDLLHHQLSKAAEKHARLDGMSMGRSCSLELREQPRRGQPEETRRKPS